MHYVCRPLAVVGAEGEGGVGWQGWEQALCERRGPTVGWCPLLHDSLCKFSAAHHACRVIRVRVRLRRVRVRVREGEGRGARVGWVGLVGWVGAGVNACSTSSRGGRTTDVCSVHVRQDSAGDGSGSTGLFKGG